MQVRVWPAVMMLSLGIAMVSAQSPAGSPPQASAPGSMQGMDMGKGAAPATGQSPSKPMDMSQCMAMMKGKKGDKPMQMSADGKGMEKCPCMAMMKAGGKPMGMGHNMGGMQMGSAAGTPMAMGQSSQPMDMGQGHSMGHGMAMGQADLPAGTLKLTFGEKSAEWTPATLAALPHTTVTVYNEHAKANQTYSGVALLDLLTKIGVPDRPKGKEMRLYLVAVGSDGYEAVYALAEINPYLHDATVMVADTMAGKSLAGTGPMQLIATGEKHPSRWVRNLVAVRVVAAE